MSFKLNLYGGWYTEHRWYTPPFECGDCGMGFGSAAELVRHVLEARRGEA